MKSPEQVVRDAQRINEFMNDDAIGGPEGAISLMERRYYEEFVASTSSEERVRAWAKANVLKDFIDELRVIIGAGEMEVLKAASEAKKHASRKPSEQ